MGQVAAAIAANFRPFTGFDSRGVISDTFTNALGAIPAANSAVAAGLAGRAIDQLGGIKQQEMILEQRDKEFEAERKSNRRKLALNLAQAFGSGGLLGGGSGGANLLSELPAGFNANKFMGDYYQLNSASRQDARDASGYTRGYAAGALQQLSKPQG